MARSSFCPEAMMSKESIVVALFALVKLMTAGILAHFLRLECDYFWVSKHMPTRIYVGNLDREVPPEKEDLARKFKKYGDIVDVWVSRQPPGFAFVTYDTYKDALKAIEGMDGVKFQGKNLNIQLSMGKGGGGGAQPGPKQRRSRSRVRRSSSRRRSRSRRSRRRSSERRRRDRSRSRSGSPRRDRRSPSYGR
ncbi:unnamed protein product [Cladocopium goreaui]|uniref:RRM domain-containing protein n=1 Tax=Cladocopium goreaui TaxID=2562237 RepID=A0A9P1G8V2_9DINO|nr:unnamed protein product [Cladocopium goreaui]